MTGSGSTPSIQPNDGRAENVPDSEPIGAVGTRQVPTGPCSLYRFFAADGELLYVGITNQGVQRFKQHAKTKSWWPEVARSTVEHFDSRDAAREMELAAIAWEQPAYNIADRVPPPTMPSGIRETHPTEDFVEEIEDLVDRLRDLVRDVDVTDGLTEAGYDCFADALRGLEGLAAAERAWLKEVSERLACVTTSR